MTDAGSVINVELGRNTYPIHIGSGTLGDPDLWQPHVSTGTVLIVSNEVVAPLYASTLTQALAGRAVHLHVIPDGERYKTIATWSGILDRLISIGARRDASVIALGGGVVGDISGFAAASYMRGIRFLQAPTTLLAQVDAAVGGKTGVNHARGKNLIGAFHQPAAVIIDTDTLDTLPEREFLAGMAEVVKYGAIMDAPLLDWLEASLDPVRARDSRALGHIVTRSVASKARIVAADEFEGGVRALLNFGHTFGHALEAATAYSEYLHGEAVAIGMVIAARLSEIRRLCPQGRTARLERLLKALGLPHRLPAHVSTESLIETMGLDKKAVAGGLRLILLQEFGKAVIDDRAEAAEIVSAIEASRPATFTN